MSQTGITFNIQRFSLHDGPGMRTVLFLKGCPLNCRWCSNPESKHPGAELLYYQARCIGCGLCVKAAGGRGIRMTDKGIAFDRETVDAELCAGVCPTGALEIIGRKQSVDELIPLLLRDQPFFRRSGGGITLSGGEPTMQTSFCREMLRRLKELGINTAVETCGYRKWEAFHRAVEPADLILYDLKGIDSEAHTEAVGVSNELILDNFARLVPLMNVTARIPVIPGYNDRDEIFKRLSAFLSNTDFRGEVHLLPYHSYGSGKYKALGEEYQLAGAETPSEERLKSWAYFFESEGFITRIHKH